MSWISVKRKFPGETQQLKTRGDGAKFAESRELRNVSGNSSRFAGLRVFRKCNYGIIRNLAARKPKFPIQHLAKIEVPIVA